MSSLDSALSVNKQVLGINTAGGATTSVIGKGVKYFTTTASDVAYKPTGKFTTSSGGGTQTASGIGAVAASSPISSYLLIGVVAVVGLVLFMRLKNG